MNRQAYLLDQLSAKVDGFKADSDKHKKLYPCLRYSVFVMTSLLALLAGLSLKFPESGQLISVLILLISATMSVVTSIEGLRKPSELWIHERTTYYMLKDLKREVEFLVDESTQNDVIESYFFRMQTIHGASNENAQNVTKT